MHVKAFEQTLCLMRLRAHDVDDVKVNQWRTLMTPMLW
jgi:hypothetical protein